MEVIKINWNEGMQISAKLGKEEREIIVNVMQMILKEKGSVTVTEALKQLVRAGGSVLLKDNV